MGQSSSSVAPINPPTPRSGNLPSPVTRSAKSNANNPVSSQHSYSMGTTKQTSSASSKSIVVKGNSIREGDAENAEESLKSIFKNDGLRRACLKFCIACEIDFLFHIFVESSELLQNPTETECFEMIRSFRNRFEEETNEQVTSRFDWQRIRDLILNPDALDTFQNARATISMCKQIAVIALSIALDSFLDSAFFETWDKLRIKQEMNMLSASPIRRGLARYGSCPNPKLIQVQNSVAAATAWVNDPNLDAETKTKAFAKVFPNILVVDDSNVSVKLSANSIKADGHSVRSAHNGKIGLQMAMAEQFQIIIVDIFMPVMNGFELIKLLRQSFQSSSHHRKLSDVSTTMMGFSSTDDNSKSFVGSIESDYGFEENSYIPTLWKHPPILIAMTADHDDENILKAFEAGADYFIEKPMTLAKLVDCLL